MKYINKASQFFSSPGLPIYSAFFLLGIYSINLQSILLREFLVVFYGNELVSGLLLGGLLFSIGLGSWLYRRFSGPQINHRLWFSLALIALGTLSPFQLLWLRNARTILQAQPGVYLPFGSILWFSLIILLPLGCLIGLLFPLGFGGLNQRGGKELSQIYILESLGFLLGGILFSFYLVERFSPFEIFTWGLILLLLCGIWINLTKYPKMLAILTILILFGGFLLLPIAAIIENHSLQTRWLGLNPSLPLLKSRDTRYQNLTLTRQRELFSLFGNGNYDFSFPDPYQEETIAALTCTQHPHPQKILLLGDASPGLLQNLLDFPVKKLDWVLLDPRLLDFLNNSLSSKNLAPLYNPRLAIHYQDGRAWIKSSRESYDLIILQVSDPSTAMVNRFYTRDFFRACRKIMANNGVLALSITSGENYLGTETIELAGSIYHTLKTVFPILAISPGDKNYFFAELSPGSCSENPNILISRMQQAGIKFRHFDPLYLKTFYYPERIKFTRLQYENATNPQINTDLRPVAYFYALKLWLKISGETAGRIFGMLEKIGFTGFLSGLLLLGVLVWILTHWVFPRKQLFNFNLFYAVGSVGFSSLSCSLLLLFAFQNYYGYIYQMVGLYFALFMLGLALGGLISREIIRQQKVKAGQLAAIQFEWMIFTIALPLLLPLSRYFAFPWLILLLVIISGILGGIIFPLAACLMMKEHGGEKSASFINAADHFGGALGAICFGIILIPLLGIIYSCWLLALIHLLGLSFWQGCNSK